MRRGDTFFSFEAAGLKEGGLRELFQVGVIELTEVFALPDAEVEFDPVLRSGGALPVADCRDDVGDGGVWRDPAIAVELPLFPCKFGAFRR